MGINFDSYFGVSAKALAARDQKASVIANNLANVNTPNYKAQDLSFDDYLAATMSGSAQKINVTSSGHMSTNADFSTILKQRPENQASLDGNTVDKDLETTEFLKNSVSYQASLNFITSKIKNMMSAIKGE